MDADASARKKGKSHFKPNRLKYYRKMRNWTQADVAEELYKLCNFEERERGIINTTMVGRWERGEHAPGLFWQKKLCMLFEATPNELGLLDTEPSAPSHAQPQRFVLQSHHPLLDLPSYEALAGYLRQQQRHLSDALAPGSSSLRIGDVINDNTLFIPPPWKSTLYPAYSEHLSEHLMDALLQKRRVLLLGDAGQGKTLILKQVFVRLVECFLENTSGQCPFPLYLPLRECSSLVGNALELLWAQIHEDFPLSYEQFTQLMKHKQVVLLFDGFDEIRGEITQRSINERATSKIFAHPSLLSCRKSFFEFYLSMSPLVEYYPHQVELQPLTFTDSVIYSITAFCNQKHHNEIRRQFSLPEKIVETIQASHELLDLAQRPLLLMMILEVFTDPKELHEEQWSMTKLYRKYTERWLKHEAAKPDSVLKWHEKALLLQEVAWSMYMGQSASSSHPSARQSVAITQEELWTFVQGGADRYRGVTAAQILDDLCFRTFLSVSEGESYAFLHKSFLEYFVARYAFERMHGRDLAAIEYVFQVSMPFDIAAFLKRMLKESTFHEQSQITANLIHVYQHNGTDDPRATTIRQQASHYLTSLGTQPAIQFLEQVCQQEPNKWVQRGIYVGLAYYSGKTDVLERYICILREDQEAATINLKYHLIYYGDQSQQVDDPLPRVERCERTIKALFRHLRDQHYQSGWALDILTLSALLERQGIALLQNREWQMSFLKDFLRRDHAELGDIFQQEKERLKQLLKGAITWN